MLVGKIPILKGLWKCSDKSSASIYKSYPRMWFVLKNMINLILIYVLSPRAFTCVLWTILRARNLPFSEGFLRAAMCWALTEKKNQTQKNLSHAPEHLIFTPIKHEANRNGKVAFPYAPSEGFCAIPDKLCVCNPRAGMCHGTRGCLCPRTVRAELNQGETSPQHRQLFCGNNKTKGSAGTGCPLNWRSGGCCFQQSTCVFISASFACVCLSFLISRRPGPDYIHRRVLLN